MAARFTLGRVSSLKPVTGNGVDSGGDVDGAPWIEDLRIMYLAHDGDLEGVRSLLDEGANPNFSDEDGRTALHVAACEGFVEVVKLLLDRGADPEPKDLWGSTPLADAIHYKKQAVVKVLEQHGAQAVAPMHVNSAREIPEYEIDRSELDFTGSIDISKGTFCLATWRGIKVAVKQLNDGLIDDEEKVQTFRDELALLQLVRHPNVVQFLGAITQRSPMMIVTEYLPKGDLRTYLDKKGALKPSKAIKFALDIARGMNYLHEGKSGTIIHRDLKPSNILLDDSGHLKVADFGISKLLKQKGAIRDDSSMAIEYSGKYVAPELYRKEEFDVKVDVFSFALILYEMIEGHPPFPSMSDDDAMKAYASKDRPPYRPSSRHYAHGLKELIRDCWSDIPARRPPFKDIIVRLTHIQNEIAQRKSHKGMALGCLHVLFFWMDDHSLDTESSHSSHSD